MFDERGRSTAWTTALMTWRNRRTVFEPRWPWLRIHLAFLVQLVGELRTFSQGGQRVCRMTQSMRTLTMIWMKDNPEKNFSLKHLRIVESFASSQMSYACEMMVWNDVTLERGNSESNTSPKKSCKIVI